MNTNNLLEAGFASISVYLIEHYHQLKMTNDEFLVYLQLLASQTQRVDMPSAQSIATRLQTTETAINQLLKSLLDKQLIKIDTVHGRYDLTAVLQKATELKGSHFESTPHIEQASASHDARREVFNIIEVEFGQTLSPMQLETIGKWFDEDHFDPQLIALAVREASANNVHNLRYIESILVNWQKANVHTTAEAKAQTAQHRQNYAITQNSASSATEQLPKIDIPLEPFG